MRVRLRGAGGEDGEVRAAAGGVWYGTEGRSVGVGCACNGRPARAAEDTAIEDAVEAVRGSSEGHYRNEV